MIRLLTDFHHSSLLRATNMLFGDRLHMMVYRPIGMEWFEDGWWAINDQRPTAEQFLLPDGPANEDGTPLLGELTKQRDAILGEMPADGVYHVKDPGGLTAHRACTLEFFKANKFDYIIASVPQHVQLFERLIKMYQPQAKLIVQIGNEWPLSFFERRNVLASIAPRRMRANAYFYHQEFDTEIFKPTPIPGDRKVFSFVNCIKEYPQAWTDYSELKALMEPKGWDMRSYGGQCPDGNANGPLELATMMQAADFIFHVKPGGDGFGHVIHNAYATGRPVITRPSHYRHQLAEQLLIPGTFIDLDRYSLPEVKNMLTRLSYDPEGLQAMSDRASLRFREVVNYDAEAKDISEWLGSLL